MKRAARWPIRATVLAWAAALAPLLWVVPTLRHALESRMAAHMLIEFPLLMAAGWAAATLAARTRTGLRVARAWRGVDAHGLNGALFASAVLLVWMLPSALDAALIEPAVNAGKAASWCLAGALLAASLPRLSAGLLLFFAGNAVWMMATAGLLYQEAAEALCVNYLPADQHLAGQGLIALACLLTVLAGARLWRHDRPAHPMESNPESTHAAPCVHATRRPSAALNP